jgi:undecaprenyl-diphosphatase
MSLARLEQLARRERGTLIALAAVLLLIAGFALLAGEVAEAQTESFDHAILHALRDADGHARGPHWLQTALLNLSALGSTAVMTLLVTLAAAVLLLKRRARLALLVIGCGVGAAIAVIVLKDHVGRERPMVVVALEAARGLSFPSGHSLSASAIYPTLGILLATAFPERRLRVFTIATTVVLALVIGFTRVYLGVHHPTDVIGGWMLGLAWAIVCGLVCRRLQREGLVERAEPVRARSGP